MRCAALYFDLFICQPAAPMPRKALGAGENYSSFHAIGVL
jgi:hypothetical protein